jgi:hypothetical protein
MAETASAPSLSLSPAPEQGQLVRVRNRLFLVQDVFPHESGVTRLDLECLDDNRLGETLSVLWEREVHPEILQADRFPAPSGRWDHPETFDAFLTAIRWSSSSAIRGSALQSAFRGAIELEPYQLEPASRAVLMPRVNLLIADDTGLGKTIEAGLVIQELLARARIRNCLVVCPASLQTQWQEEMEEKFDLEFRTLERDAVLRLRREYGVHVNPWLSYPRLITSLDYLKREAVMSQLRLTFDTSHSAAATWDLLILDEAHNCAPAGRRKYVRDSDRTRALREIAPHFQHRLFLTATPHNGFTESFTALLSELDPLRFHRAPTVDAEQVRTVMVRRLKKQLTDSGEVLRPFPDRRVVALPVPDVPAERQTSEVLDEYIRLRVERAESGRGRLAVRFALNLLKKRFLSSPLAFARSLETHLEHVSRPSAGPEPDEELVRRLIDRSREEVQDDLLRDAQEQEALRESSRFFGPPTPEEDRLLAALDELARRQAGAEDAKLRVLKGWIESHLFTGATLGSERLIVFTEYRDTLEYLWRHLGEWLGRERLLFLVGGEPVLGPERTRLPDREVTKAAFQAPPDEHPVRLLLATDAAAEGLNLQKHCRYLIHYEIPWNPNRLEQRNGRIDRHGQPALKVFVHHFLHENRRDSQFLETVVQKVQQMREDLGAVAALLEESVERFMLGRTDIRMDTVKPRRTLRDDVRQEIWDKQRLRQLRQLAEDARREGNLYPETLRQVLDAALRLEGHTGLEPAEGELAAHGALLRRPPESWGERCARSVKDARGRLLTLVFDPEQARERRDVALIHLDHPLLKRALASFRRRMFGLGLGADERLHRVTYRVAPAGVLPGPFLVARVRLLAAGSLGQKLHEELRSLVWRIADGKLLPAGADLLDLIPPGGHHPPLSTLLGERLARLVEREEPRLRQALLELEAAERSRLEAELAAKSLRDEAEVVQMIKTRQQEIRARLKEIARELRILDVEQLPLDFGPEWDRLEAEQLRQDVRLLQERQKKLDEEVKSEPIRIRERYRLRSLNAFPLGLEFLLPEAVVRHGSLE